MGTREELSFVRKNWSTISLKPAHSIARDGGSSSFNFLAGVVKVIGVELDTEHWVWVFVSPFSAALFETHMHSNAYARAWGLFLEIFEVYTYYEFLRSIHTYSVRVKNFGYRINNKHKQRVERIYFSISGNSSNSHATRMYVSSV